MQASCKSALLGWIVFLLCAGAHPRPAQAGPSEVAVRDSAVVVSVVPDSVVVVSEPADSTRLESDSTHVEDVHPQDSPVDRGFLIVNPALQATLRIFGSIRLHGGYDLNGLQSSDFFDTYAIPVGAANKSEPRFFMDVTQTRIGLESRNASAVGDVLMHIEGDFRSPTKTLRLVHAYGTVRGSLAGLTWSTFGDPSAIPPTVDVIGPNSSVGERAIQARITREISKTLKWSLAIETNTPEITQPETLVTEPAFQNLPNLAGRVKRSGDWGHVQLAGVLRSLTLNPAPDHSQHLLGYGGLASGQAVLTEHDDLLFQIVGGRAVARYIAALAGTGNDAVYDPTRNQFEILPTAGWELSYGHQWQPGLKSYATAGVVRIFERDFQPVDALERTEYFSANLLLSRVKGLRAGLEYSWGRRVDKNGEDGTANRISFSVYYDY